MNAYQQAEQLKHLSDQQLSMERGRLPEYLLASELARRQQMRQAFEADRDHAQKNGGRTVSEELWSTVESSVPPQGQPMQPQQGPLSPAAPPQFQQQQQPMSIGGLVRMAQGGMVQRYAGGGGPLIDYYTPPPVEDMGPPTSAMIDPGIPMPQTKRTAFKTLADIAAAMGPQRSMQDYVADARSMAGEDQLGPIMAEMAALKQKGVVNKPSIWEALMRNGAAMMASRNPTPLGGLGEGLTAALNGYSQDRQAYQSDQARLQQMAMQQMAARAQLAQQMNQRNMGIAELGGRMSTNDSHQRNTDLSMIQQGRLSEDSQNAQLALEQQREAANAALNQPYKEAQAEALRAQAEQRNRANAVYQAYLKKANGDEAKAQMMMARDQALATHIEGQRHYSPLEMLQMGAIAEGRKRGESDDEIMMRILQGKTRAGITEEKRNQAIVSRFRALGGDKLFDPDEKAALMLEAERQIDSGSAANPVKAPKAAAQEQPGFFSNILGGIGSIFSSAPKQQPQQAQPMMPPPQQTSDPLGIRGRR